MKGIWVVPIIASILIIGTFGIVQDIYAPPQKAEKIKVDSISWNTESQSFVLSVQMHHGIAKAAQNADFIILTELTITDPISSNAEEETYAIDIDPFDLSFSNGEPIVFELHMPWDRVIKNEFFEGEVVVSAGMRFLSLSDYGINLAGVTIDDFTVEVKPLPECTSDDQCSEGEICDPFSASCVDALVCESNADCPEGELCTGNVCLSVQECDSESDCPAGTFCVINICYLEPACSDDDDCAEGESCEAGICQTLECVSDVDCLEGFVCESNRCVLDSFCSDDSDCQLGEECVNSMCTVPTPTD